MITDVPDLKSVNVEENKKAISNWLAENSHIPPMFLVPFLMNKTIINVAKTLIEVKEAKKKRKEMLLNSLKHVTVILPK